MLVAIISDTHDNIWNLAKALEIFKKKNVSALIHCGDFCAPFIIKKLDELGVPVHCVFGNTDDRFSTTEIALGSKNVKLYGDVAQFELDNKKIAITHFPIFAKGIAHTKEQDIVFYGHNHTKKQEIINNTLLVNPGELSGVKNTPSFAIYDTETNKVEFFDLK